MTKLKDITVNFLFDKGFDGLFNPEQHCACLCTNLMPCNGPSEQCSAGYKTDIDGRSFKISLEKDNG